MKKFRILTILFAFALILTGCATVSNVRDANGRDVYFDNVQYNYGQVVEVGDYVYYGNGFKKTGDSGFDYNESAKYAYLARLDVKSELKVENEDNSLIQSTSPNGIEKVNDKLVGYENQNMFALGSYLYFTSANTHKTGNMENDYTQVSLFRVKFNGDGLEELGTFKHDDDSLLDVRKGSDGNYYYVLTQKIDDTTNLYSLKIGDTLGKLTQLNKYEKDGKTVIDSISNIVLCDDDSMVRRAVYTTSLGTIKSVDFATGEMKEYPVGNSNASVTLIDMVGDIVFYSYTLKAKTEVYYKNIATDSTAFTDANLFYTQTSIKNVKSVKNGYVFISGTSNSVMYKTLGDMTSVQLLLTSSDYADLLFTEGDYLYYSSATSLGRVNVTNQEKEEIVKMTAIISGKVGYTGSDLYFYAQLEEKAEDNTDSNYYMYRTDKNGNYQLVGQTN